MKNNFSDKDLVTVDSLGRSDLDLVISKACEMENLVEKYGGSNILKGKILAALFYEPSSRTFSSFIAAMQRLGGGIIPLNNMTNTSVVKGETFEDTIRVFSAYADVIVIRHGEVGAPQKAAKITSVPIINAGDGSAGEHPSQGLIDLYTIWKIFHKIENLHIVMVGDLAHYRGVNSLAKLLANYKKVKISFVSHNILKINDNLKNALLQKKVEFYEYEKLDDVISQADVLNVTRVKKEYMTDELYEKVKSAYIVNSATLAKMKKNSIIIHNLPRINEITPDVDLDPRAVYFHYQVRNGLYMRMALLDLILNNK